MWLGLLLLFGSTTPEHVDDAHGAASEPEAHGTPEMAAEPHVSETPASHGNSSARRPRDPYEGPAGSFTLAVSPGASVIATARREGHLDLIIHGNRIPLADGLDAALAPWLRSARGQSVGNGTWLIDLRLVPGAPPPAVSLQAGALQVGPEPMRTSMPDLPASLRHPAHPPDVGLHPLWGDARTLALASERWPLSPPTDHGAELHGDLAKPPSWRNLAGYRRAMLAAHDDRDREIAWSRLAEAYMALGAPREALAYLKRLPASFPGVEMRRATAQLDLGDHEGARAACERAVDAGAGATAWSCLGRIALATGAPNPSHVGVALLVVGDGPVHRLLGAELLAADHRWADARPVLEALARSFPDPLVWAELGDARYATGDVAGARTAWQRARGVTELRPLLGVRQLLIELASGGPSTWARHLPDLLETAERGGNAGLEARYLVSQVVEAWGDRDVAIHQLGAMWDEDVDRALRSDVPERLVANCHARMAALARAHRPIEEIAVFRTCWRTGLDTWVADPEPIERAAVVLLDLGLPEAALEMEQRALTIRSRREDDRASSMVRLANLYTATGRPEEALRTLAFASRLPDGATLVGAMDVSKGRAYAAKGDRLAAHRAWGRVKAGPDALDATAHLGLSLAQAGDCAPAVPRLRAALEATMPPRHGRVADDDLVLALARCLVDGGKPAEAHAVAGQATGAAASVDAAAVRGRAALDEASLGTPESGWWKKVVDEVRAGDAWLTEARTRIDGPAAR